MEKEKTMMLYTTATNGEKTFGMIPLNTSCPFNEAIYMPKLEALAVLSKSTRDTFTFLDRLDENGETQSSVVKTKEGAKQVEKKQRVQIASPWEYFIHEKMEIRDFIKTFAINADEYDYNSYMTSLEVVEKPKIIMSGE
jgi:hypothetical protein